jgi:hypothetical protein
MFEKISAYRHEARHETRNEALVALIAAGLAALAKPPALPVVSASKTLEAQSERPKGRVPFAGFDDRRHASAVKG